MRLTPRMKKMASGIYGRTGVPLRPYVLKRFHDDPSLTVDAFAAELGVNTVTLYRWLDRLQIAVAPGPRLVDLVAQQEAEAAAFTHNPDALAQALAAERVEPGTLMNADLEATRA